MEQTIPAWWPVAPEYRVQRNGMPSGTKRNKSCKCGSGQKAKSCTACGVVIKPTIFPISYEAYSEEVKRLTKEAECIYDNNRVYTYYLTQAISIEQAVQFLVEYTKLEKEAGRYPAIYTVPGTVSGRSRRSNSLASIGAMLALCAVAPTMRRDR